MEPKLVLAWAVFAILLLLCIVKIGIKARRWFRSPPAQEPDVIQGLVTLHQAYEGILVLGGTGSGKTTGPGAEIALNLMKSGAGFCVLTAKVDEYPRFLAYARATGREADLVRIAPDQPWRMDFINEELRSPGGDAVTAGQMMADLVDSVSKGLTDNDQPFWPITASRLIRCAITLVYAAKRECSVRQLYQFVMSMPTSAQIADPSWRNTAYCAQCIVEAMNNQPDDPDVELAATEVLKTWPSMSDKTSGCVMAYIIATLDPFLNGPVARLVTGPSTFSGLDVLNGKIAILDCPVLRYRESGRLLQLVVKSSVQRHALRRPITPDMRPVVLWGDEAQFFLTESDCLTQTVARQSKLISVMLAQNLPMLYHARGGGPKAKQEMDGLIANHMTKVLCSNACQETNAFFSELIGQHRELFMNGSSQMGEFDIVGDCFGNPGVQTSGGFSEQMVAELLPSVFTKLQKGGKSNAYLVEGILFQGGRQFPQNDYRTWLKASFNQHLS